MQEEKPIKKFDKHNISFIEFSVPAKIIWDGKRYEDSVKVARQMM